jgi:hypothetical protein
MRIKILFTAILLAGCFCNAGETIIDPELMSQETWAEPYFPSDEEVVRMAAIDAQREPSSEVAANEAPVKNADEYLDVLKSIPSSEPTLSRAWIEYKILHED